MKTSKTEKFPIYSSKNKYVDLRVKDAIKGIKVLQVQFELMENYCKNFKGELGACLDSLSQLEINRENI